MTHDEANTTEINSADLERLATFSTPTICNAVEKFDPWPRNTGYMNHQVRPLFPELGTIIGFAVTVTTMASNHVKLPGSESRLGYYNYIHQSPRTPKILVIQDLDEPAMIGAFIGDVNANIHKRLGCVGAISNSATRDLSELRQLPFPVWGKGVSVSHAYVQVCQYGVPVNVGGLIVQTGDLLMADQHGVVKIPLDVVRKLPPVAREIERRERKIIEFCQSDDFSVEGLIKFNAAVTAEPIMNEQ